MPLINMPPSLQTMMGDLDKRVRKLEQSPFRKPYGSWISTNTQAAVSSASVQPINAPTMLESNLISVVSNYRFTVERAGYYNLQFSAQIHNSDAQDYNAQIWLRHNNVDEPDSNTQITVPGKHGSVNGAAVAAWNFLTYVDAGGDLALWWWAESLTLSLPSVAAGTSPTRPSVPSVIVTMHEVAW